MRSNAYSIGVLAVAITVIFASCTHVSIKTENHFDAVQLPDNSVVYLNQHSSIDFNKSFRNRKVTLFGEGLFQVVPGDKPFIIETTLGNINVVGTEFNVKADKVEVEVEVIEGAVELAAREESLLIKKGERGVYKKSTSDLHKGKARFKYKIWMKDLRMEFKALNKKIRPAVKPFIKSAEKKLS